MKPIHAVQPGIMQCTLISLHCGLFYALKFEMVDCFMVIAHKSWVLGS